jgi:long-chain acyl-CoA synthetase
MVVKELLERQKENHKTAIICGSKSISYAQLHNKAYMASKELISGCMDHYSIGLFIHNSINYITAYFSVSYSEKVIVPISTRIKADELKSTVEYCELRTIVSDSANIELLRKYFECCEYEIRVFNIDTTAFEYMGGDAALPVCGSGELEDVALMLHTSGSLSSPKRVMLTHVNLISCVEAIIRSLNITPDDRTLIALPLFLASANTSQMLVHIYLGASIVIMDALFTAEYFFKLVEKHQITNFTGVPFMMLSLIDNKNSKQRDISSLRFICFGGAPTPAAKIYQLVTAFPGIGFVHMYGQTEAATRITHLLPEDQLGKTGSVGKAIPGMQLRLVNEAGNDAAQGEVGEVIVKGKNVMKGYYKRKEQTRQTLVNGWLYTGDLGRFDRDGFLYIVGRRKNVIIKGGMNIYPEEIEELLMQHPAVKEVCVSGEEHELLGEAPVAKIVLKDNAGRINEEMLMRYCLGAMSSFKIPERIQIVAELPKTDSGKLIRLL